MKTKTILKTLAVALLMPAMLLTSACSNQDDVVNNTAENTVTNKGYALPVTVNVTRQGDGTRATYNESTKKLEFSTGDKLFVNGRNDNGPGQFAGTLDYVPATGKFSGTIYTRNSYSGTADALFSNANPIYASLLPNGYESTGFLYVIDNNTTDIAYDDQVTVHETKAFVASETAKATGVEQFSWERASTYSNGFALAPLCAVLNFTISGLEAGASQNVTLRMNKDGDYLVTGSVTPNALGVATFAIGVKGGSTIRNTENNLTVGTHNFTLPSSTTFTAGKIYNITRAVAPSVPAGALSGEFTINSSGDKVYFSKGNLRYASGTWSFFDNQYDYYTSYSADAWDKFGWSTSATTYGMNTSDQESDYSGDFVDWGSNSDLQTALGTGWFTLSKDEWVYLFGTDSSNKRTTTSGLYFAKATVNGVSGVILLPDDWSTSNYSLNSTNSTGAAYDTNTISESDWSSNFEAHGCVFLPAAGFRKGTSVNNVGSHGNHGNYWSSTASGTDQAYCVIFNSGDVYPVINNIRNYGFSVRLVRPVPSN